jgi:hypothetical protein
MLDVYTETIIFAPVLYPSAYRGIPLQAAPGELCQA